MVRPEQFYLEMLREETARLGIILIFDEVWSLRGSYNGYQGIVGITPDITTMRKIIGGGIPVGAIGGSARHMSVFELTDQGPKIKHSGTFTANPMAMALGYTSLSLLTPEAFDDLEAKGERLREGLRAIAIDLALPVTIEGEGSLSALVLSTRVMRNYRELSAGIAEDINPRLPILQRFLGEEQILTMRGMFVGSAAMNNEDIDFTIIGVRRALANAKADGLF